MLELKSRFSIIGANFTVPPRIQSSVELAAELDCSSDWIEENVGVRTRRVADQGTDPARLGALAARPLLHEHGRPDALIYASATVRQCIPDTSVFVLRELGLESIPSYSVNATCLSFLVALQNAALLVQSGQHRKVMIVSAELPTFSRNFADPKSAALFGDAAAAVMIEATDQPMGMVKYSMESWPEFADLASVRGGGLLRHPDNPRTVPSDYYFDMNGDQLLRAALPKLKRFLVRFFDDIPADLSDVKLTIPHQASAAGMKILQRIGFAQENTIDILSEYGNCVSASIPMALSIARSQHRIQDGDLVFMLGTAAGLSIGATLIRC